MNNQQQILIDNNINTDFLRKGFEANGHPKDQIEEFINLAKNINQQNSDLPGKQKIDKLFKKVEAAVKYQSLKGKNTIRGKHNHYLLSIVSYILSEPNKFFDSFDEWLNIAPTIYFQFKDHGFKLFKKVSNHFETEGYDLQKIYSGFGENVKGKKVNIQDVFSLGKVENQDKHYWPLIEFIAGLNHRRNEITGNYELKDGTIIIDGVENRLKMESERKGIRSSMTRFLMFLRCDHVPSYHPILEKLNSLSFKPNDGPTELDKLLQSIKWKKKDDTINSIVRKWFYQLAAILFGAKCELMLVLIGPQGTGKNYFFDHLLPADMRHYFVNDKLDGRDPEKLMITMWLILDDEFSGKNKQDARKIKSLMSKQKINVRFAWDKHFTEQNRLCVFCGASNEPDILNDSTGNRRIIPLEMIDRDREAYDAIDKNRLLWEIYHTWLNDKKCHLLNSDEVIYLNQYSDENQSIDIERDSLMKCFLPVIEDSAESETMVSEWQNNNKPHYNHKVHHINSMFSPFLTYDQKKTNEKPQSDLIFITSTEAANYCNEAFKGLKLNSIKIGRQIKLMNWKKIQTRRNGSPTKGYLVRCIYTSVDGDIIKNGVLENGLSIEKIPF